MDRTRRLIGVAALAAWLVPASVGLAQGVSPSETEFPPAQGDEVVINGHEQGTSARLLIKEGNAQFEIGEPTQALAKYEAALQADPEAVEAAFNRGCALYRLGRLDEAAEAFRRVEAAPTCSPEVAEAARYNTARALMEKAAGLESGGQWPEALEGYQQASELFGDVARQNAEDADAARNFELSRLSAARVQELMRQQQEMARKRQQMADELKNLSRQQQQAADQTAQTSHDRRQQQQDQQDEQPDQQPDEKQQELQQQQQELNEQTQSLSDQLQQMQQQQQQAQQKLDEARQAQQEASEQLEQGNLEQAEQSQREASKKLNEAAEALQPPYQNHQQQPSLEDQQNGQQQEQDGHEQDQQQQQHAQEQQGQEGENAEDGEPMEPSAELVQALIDREWKNREAREKARQLQRVHGQSSQPDKDW